MKGGGQKFWVGHDHVPEEIVEIFYGRDGGKSCRKNPKGRDGQIMKCFGCGSDEHLEAH